MSGIQPEEIPYQQDPPIAYQSIGTDELILTEKKQTNDLYKALFNAPEMSCSEFLYLAKAVSS